MFISLRNPKRKRNSVNVHINNRRSDMHIQEWNTWDKCRVVLNGLKYIFKFIDERNSEYFRRWHSRLDSIEQVPGLVYYKEIKKDNTCIDGVEVKRYYLMKMPSSQKSKCTNKPGINGCHTKLLLSNKWKTHSDKITREMREDTSVPKYLNMLLKDSLVIERKYPEKK